MYHNSSHHTLPSPNYKKLDIFFLAGLATIVDGPARNDLGCWAIDNMPGRLAEDELAEAALNDLEVDVRDVEVLVVPEEEAEAPAFLYLNWPKPVFLAVAVALFLE